MFQLLSTPIYSKLSMLSYYVHISTELHCTENVHSIGDPYMCNVYVISFYIYFYFFSFFEASIFHFVFIPFVSLGRRQSYHPGKLDTLVQANIALKTTKFQSMPYKKILV